VGAGVGASLILQTLKQLTCDRGSRFFSFILTISLPLYEAFRNHMRLAEWFVKSNTKEDLGPQAHGVALPHACLRARQATTNRPGAKSLSLCQASLE